MKSAAQVLKEANRLAPEPSAYRMGEDGTPSRFATVLMRLLDTADGAWEMKLLQIEPAELRRKSTLFRGVFRFTSGEMIAFSDNDVLTASDEDKVIRFPDGRFAGVWDGRDMGTLAAVMAQAGATSPLVPLEREGGGVGTLTPEQARAMVDHAENWSAGATRDLAIPEGEILNELKSDSDRALYLNFLKSYRKVDEMDPAEVQQQFFAP